MRRERGAGLHQFNVGKAAHITTWKQVDEEPIGFSFGAKVVPVVHPSMPNRRHRVVAKTLDEEAALLKSAKA